MFLFHWGSVYDLMFNYGHIKVTNIFSDDYIYVDVTFLTILEGYVHKILILLTYNSTHIK